MAALPYMPLYVADYLADAAHLSTVQHGAYLLLIFNYWQRGEPLPNDDIRLARIARMTNKEWARNRDVLCEFFTVDENLWTHRRVNSELAHVSAKSLKSKAAAQASVERRFGVRSASVERPLNHTDTDTEKKESKKVTAVAAPFEFDGKVIKLTAADFRRWAKAYPAIDLGAVLQSRDDWLDREADDKLKAKWFIPTSNYLANLQQRAKTSERQPDAYANMP